jgi:CelD/BcsL family acetyltransferase involved in cellulose biosynthesis
MAGAARRGLMRVEWAEGRDAFAALAERWEPLAAGEPHPFADHAWLSAWHDAFGEGRALRAALAWRGEELTAALPLVARGRRLWAPANYHSPIFSAPALDAEACRAVIDAVIASSRGELFAHALEEGGGTLAALRAEAGRQRHPVVERAAHVSPFVDTAGDLDAWLAARGSTLRRRRRKIGREHEVVLRLEATAERLEEGFALEGSGWKAGSGTAIASAPETLAFYTDIARAYSARGELVLAWLDIDGAPVAFHLSLRRHARLYMLKTGYDPAARALAPGLLLHLLTAEHCFRDPGVEAYELLGETERWKLELSTGVREHRQIRVYPRRPAALAAWAARRWGAPLARAARDRVKRPR